MKELSLYILDITMNSVKAGAKNISISLGEYDGIFSFSVEDDGCGMTKEQIARAFEPFYKADKARTRRAGGAGLGLPLCRKIARLHHGELHMESEIGRGTRVCYRFDTSL